MPQKNKPQNPLTFRTNADPGRKCCKMRNAKKGVQNVKKVTRNTPLYFLFFVFCDHFRVFCNKFITGAGGIKTPRGTYYAAFLSSNALRCASKHTKIFLKHCLGNSSSQNHIKERLSIRPYISLARHYDCKCEYKFASKFDVYKLIRLENLIF